MAYVLFISEQKLVDSTSIYGSVDSSLLLPYVRQAQRLYCETKLGTDLTQKLKDLITAGTINNVGNEYYKELLNDYIGDYLPNMSLYMAFPFLRFKIEAGNIYSKTSETGVALTTAEAQHLRSEILNTGEYFIERMIDFIKNNISQFPEYNTNSGADVSPDSNGFSYQGMNLDRPQGQGNKITLRDFLTPDLT
tara:strand:+ start:557 stop:1135 length:579 start_codon:yes stop_codon:yes gene_type:complete